MAKKKKSSVNRFIPSIEETSKEIKKIESSTKKEVKEDAPKAYRKKFTTMLDPKLSKALKMDAISKNKSVADIIEELVKEYLKTT